MELYSILTREPVKASREVHGAVFVRATKALECVHCHPVPPLPLPSPFRPLPYLFTIEGQHVRAVSHLVGSRALVFGVELGR